MLRPDIFGKDPSAAQNGSVIQTCKQCGAINDEHVETCSSCDAPLTNQQERSRQAAPTEGNLAVEPAWRREVAHRLEAYRQRRRRLHPDHSQPPLPFHACVAAATDERPHSWSESE